MPDAVTDPDPAPHHGEITLFTIGYQGADTPALIAALTVRGVRTLIDVRAVPWSRRPEFTKSALEEACETAGLAYVHLEGLGNPEAGRAAAKASDRAGFLKALEESLATPAGQAALDRAARLAREAGPVALMCMERDAEHCHRSHVAAVLARALGAVVSHIRPDPPPADPRQGALF